MNKKENKKNNKKIMALMGVGLLTVLGGTLAYFTTSDSITNLFNTSKYQVQVVENFVSPDEWSPGTTTAQTINVTNEGTIEMAVRASYEQKWENANGEEIPLEDNNIAAIIHFNADWVQDTDGYYYYGSKANLTKLKPNATSTSFVSGVTFNENITAGLERTESADGKTITYKSTGNGYDNAKYTLTIRVDTIQYDQALNVW